MEMLSWLAAAFLIFALLAPGLIRLKVWFKRKDAAKGMGNVN